MSNKGFQSDKVEKLLQRVRDGDLYAFDELYRLVELHSNPTKSLWLLDASRKAFAAWERRYLVAQSLHATLTEWEEEELRSLGALDE